MFFDDRKGKGGGIASAILTSAKSGMIVDKAEDQGPKDHELLTNDLLDAVHSKDMQRTHDALHALFTHFQSRQEAEGQEY